MQLDKAQPALQRFRFVCGVVFLFGTVSNSDQKNVSARVCVRVRASLYPSSISILVCCECVDVFLCFIFFILFLSIRSLFLLCSV